MPRDLDLRSTAWILTHAAQRFHRHHGLTLSAALAFHTALALAPLLLLAVWIASLFDPSLRDPMIERTEAFLGEQGATTLRDMLQNASNRPSLTSLVGWLLLGAVVITASGAFVQLQTILNSVWDVRTRPGRSFRTFVRKRAISLAMVGLFALLLLASILADATIRFIADTLIEATRLNITRWQIIEPTMSMAMIMVLIAIAFRVLPDVKIRWRQVWLGAVLTGAAFAVGKRLIAVYLGTRVIDSAYGAAGSFIAVLVWLYYSSVIFVLGAELTRAWTDRFGDPIEPDDHAERIVVIERVKRPRDDRPKSDPPARGGTSAQGRP